MMDRLKKKRRRRAIFSQGEGQREKLEESVNNEVASHSLPHNTEAERAQKRRPIHRPGRDAGTGGRPGQGVTGRGMNKEKNTELKQREGVAEKIPEGEKESQKTHNNQSDSQTLGAVEDRGERWEKQEKRETSREHGGDATQQTPDLKGPPHHSKTWQRDGPGCCGCTEGPAERAVLGQRLQMRRSNEAVWAAAALGFLLVLLTLSVLHTRLYRHWRTMPSLYWYHPQNDYDSVAGEISGVEGEISVWHEISGVEGEISVWHEISGVEGEISVWQVRSVV